jgi:di/tricarboxylate transporter
MSIIKSDPTKRTDGVAPKVAWPTIALLALGAVLCVLDKTGAIDIVDELWIGLLGSGAGVAGIGGAAPAALQRVKLSGQQEPGPESRPTPRKTI